MKVSVSLHTKEPHQTGNQRDFEALYGGYNRQYAEVAVDKVSGNGSCLIQNMKFPAVISDGEVFTHFSIGVCHAPEGYGGAIITAGPLSNPIVAGAGDIPFLGVAMCGIFRHKLQFLNLIRQNDDATWEEMTEYELRAAPDHVQ